MTANTTGGRPVLDASSSTRRPNAQATPRRRPRSGQNPLSRGYREEMEHLAYLHPHARPGHGQRTRQLKPRCDGRAAMADAIIALTANQAMKNRQRIEFHREWFEMNMDPSRDAHEVPDADMIPRGPE